MLLTRKDQARLHALCITKHARAIGFELRGLARALMPDRRLVLAVVLALVAMLSLYALTGCTRKAEAMLTGKVLTAKEAQAYLPGYKLDAAYGVVRSEWLDQAYQDWRADLSKDLVNWDSRFDCNAFAVDFMAYCRRSFLVDTWHSRTAAQAPAIAVYCYQPTQNTAHAVVAAITEQGLVVIEPQTGRKIKAGPPYFTVL